MKVCTDACLFGAWVAEAANYEREAVNNSVLDIGTGTGLLSLMVAQKTKAVIDAVEIDEAAAMQAQQNFQASPWTERLHVYHTSIQEFCSVNKKQYDLIISNPPFYKNDLKSHDDKRNLALHSHALQMEELVSATKKLLKEDGVFAVLLPYQRTEDFIKLAAGKNLLLYKKAMVMQTPIHAYFRSMLLFSKQQRTLTTEEIIIQNEMRQYTAAFISLLKDYYLML